MSEKIALKTLTYDGPGHELVVPGYFTLERGKAIDIPASLADTLLKANKHLNLTVTDSVTEEPPRTGQGSGTRAWAVYAATLGITTDGLSRDEIIAAVDAATTESATAAGEPEAQQGEGHDIDHQED